jgi:hypothetical protein
MQGFNGRVSHKDVYAVDFDMPEGEKVCAARSGKVVGMRKDSDKGGFDKKFMNDANYVQIEHSDGTVAMYGHFKKDGVFVDVGDVVFAGEVIGLSGKTGYVTGPHLHFDVGRGQKTIPFKFVGVGEPQERRRYTSRNKPVVTAEQKQELLAADKAARLALQYSQFALAEPYLQKLADFSDDAPLFDGARKQLKEIDEEGKRVVAKIEQEIESNELRDAVERALLNRVAFRGLAAEEKLKELEGKLLERLGRKADPAKLVHSQLLIFLEGLRLELKGKRDQAKGYYSVVAESDVSSHVVRWAKERLQ